MMKSENTIAGVSKGIIGFATVLFLLYMGFQFGLWLKG